MEPEKIESMETPTPPDNVQDAGDSPLFSLGAVLVMILVLLGGGYYFMHGTGASRAVGNSINTPAPQTQQPTPLQTQ